MLLQYLDTKLQEIKGNKIIVIFWFPSLPLKTIYFIIY